jgi:hypothetical protein
MSFMAYTPPPRVAPEHRMALTFLDYLGWATVHTALNQIVWGAGFLFGAAFIATVFLQVSLIGAGPVHPTDSSVLGVWGILIMMLLLIAGAPLVLIGIWTCCGAPRSFRGRGFIIGAVTCFVVWVGLIFLAVYLGSPQGDHNLFFPQQDLVAVANRPRPGDVNNVPLMNRLFQRALPYISQATRLACGICFLLFLRSVSVVTGTDQLRTHVTVFLVAYVIIFLGFAALNYFSGSLTLILDHPGFLRGASLTIAALLAWFAVVAGSVRTALNGMLQNSWREPNERTETATQLQPLSAEDHQALL